MNLERLLERLDNAASTLVPLLYLLGLMAGTAAYFTGVTQDAGLAVGYALSGAAEMHCFLQQRRVRSLWGMLSRMEADDPRRPQLVTQLRVNVAVLAALVAFSTYNAVAFVSTTWRPTPGFLPDWLQIGIRGAVIPAFFLLSGFLSPLHSDPGEVLARASQDMLHKTVKVMLKQWHGRIDQARRGHIDLAPMGVALMLDAGDADDARRIQLISDGLAAAEQGVTVAEIAPDRPPTGPGTPSKRSRPAIASAAAAAASAYSGTKITPITTATSAQTASAEAKVRAVWQPGMSVTQVEREIQARGERISRSTAAKYCRVLDAERTAARLSRSERPERPASLGQRAL